MPGLYSDESAFTSLNGTMFVTTFGWSSGHPTYTFVVGVLTVIWALTIAAAVYSLSKADPPTELLFDPSNPVHLMMASSAGGLQNLAGFEEGDTKDNDHVRVCLRESLTHDDAEEARRPGMHFTIVPPEAKIAK